MAHHSSRFIALAFAGLAAASTCNAEIIHNSLGPGDTYSGNSWGNGPVVPSVTSNNAVAFEIGSGAMTDISITMPLTWAGGFFGGTDDFSYSVRIYADDGIQNNAPPEPIPPSVAVPATSSVPGSLVAEYVAMAQQTLPETGPGFDVTTVGFGDLILEGGTQYWLSVELDFGVDGFVFWRGQRSDIGLDPLGLISQSAVTTPGLEADYWNVFWQENIPAFRVEGTAVPAPGSAAFVVMVGGFASRRRRHTA